MLKKSQKRQVRMYDAAGNDTININTRYRYIRIYDILYLVRTYLVLIICVRILRFDHCGLALVCGSFSTLFFWVSACSMTYLRQGWRFKIQPRPPRSIAVYIS